MSIEVFMENEIKPKKQSVLLHFKHDAVFSISKGTLGRITERMEFTSNTQTVHYFLAKLAMSTFGEFETKFGGHAASFDTGRKYKYDQGESSMVILNFRENSSTSVSRDMLRALTEHFGFMSDLQTVLYALSMAANDLVPEYKKCVEKSKSRKLTS